MQIRKNKCVLEFDVCMNLTHIVMYLKKHLEFFQVENKYKRKISPTYALYVNQRYNRHKDVCIKLQTHTNTPNTIG